MRGGRHALQLTASWLENDMWHVKRRWLASSGKAWALRLRNRNDTRIIKGVW